MIEYNDPAGDWPQIGRGGHLRNAAGHALIKIGNRNRIAVGGSDLDPFADPYTGDPIHGHRGTHLHAICDMADKGQPLDNEVIAAGATLGISPAKQQHAYDSWLKFTAAHGINIIIDHIEQPVANPVALIASNVDRVILRGDLGHIGDQKTARDIIRRSYLLQATMYAHPDTRPYNPTTGEYSDWAAPIDSDVAYLFHLSSAELIAADEEEPADWPTWSLIPIDLAVGRRQWELICAARDFDYTTAFGDPVSIDDIPPIAAPSPSLEVEPPATDDASVALAASSVATPTLSELRAKVNTTFTPKDVTALRAYFETNDTDTNNPVQVAEAVAAVEAFRDTTTEPQPRPQPAPVSQPLPTVIDEGAELTPDEIEAAGKRYAALPDDIRSWVSACGAKIRLSPQVTNGKPTVRRFELLRGLCELAETDGFGTDDMVRACAALTTLGENARQQGSVADVVAAMSLDDALLFAKVAAVVVTGNVAVRWENDDRCVLSASVRELVAA